MKIFKKMFNKRIEKKLKEIEGHRASYSEMQKMLEQEGCSYYVSGDIYYIRSKHVFVKLLDMGWRVFFHKPPVNGLYECKIERL